MHIGSAGILLEGAGSGHHTGSANEMLSQVKHHTAHDVPGPVITEPESWDNSKERRKRSITGPPVGLGAVYRRALDR